ncbi:MAG: exodeoxyribonuclease III [Methylococcales bacterium]|nr:exodeoxyribonuclease III [Methylococcales bacterium]
MRVITFNANGIRSAARKGFFTWLATQHADLVCIQETKAQIQQLDDPAFKPAGYHCYYHDAEKKGYSGVAIYSRIQPEKVIYGLDWPEFDYEGRYIEAQFPDFSVASVYLPSGTSGPVRQAVKYRVLDHFWAVMQTQAQSGRAYILCGDVNIAHKNIDLKNWRGNQKNSGFLPEERAWLDTVFDSGDWFDGFRQINDQPDQYTWWSNRGQSWANNVGWRIDYQIISKNLADKVQQASIYREQKFSDHAPLIMDYQPVSVFDAA